MSEDSSPAIALDGNTITITLPDSNQTVIPTIPEELRDHEIPSFVVEWIMESDEIATLIQELLQAPTRSLCRAMVAPTPNVAAKGGQMASPKFEVLSMRSPTPPALKALRADVKGFEMAGPTQVEGLPAGVKVPYSIMEIVAMARTVDAWMWKGMRVNEWAIENGVADASWLPASD